MAKIQLQENNYSVQVNRKILNTGTPILNKDGKQEFKIFECADHNAIYLRAKENIKDKSIKDVQDAMKLARKVASELNTGLFVDPDIANKTDILNFVKSTDNRIIPITYEEAEELGKITTINVKPENRIRYREKSRNYVDTIDEIHIPDGVRINIINNLEENNDVLSVDYMKIKTKKGDFSKIDFLNDSEKENRIKMVMVPTGEELKLPEKITDDKSTYISPKYFQYNFFISAVELPKYEDIAKILKTSPNIKLLANIKTIKEMVDDISKDLKEDKDEYFKNLVNEHGYSYLKFFDTMKELLDEHPKFLSEIYGHYKNLNFYTPIYMKKAPLFEDDEGGYHCSLLDKMENLKETIIELGLEKKGHENTMF